MNGNKPPVSEPAYLALLRSNRPIQEHIACNFIASIIYAVGPITVAQKLTDAGYNVDGSGRLSEKIDPCDRCGIKAHLIRHTAQFLCLACRLTELEHQQGDAGPLTPPGPGIHAAAEPGPNVPGSAISSHPAANLSAAQSPGGVQ